MALELVKLGEIDIYIYGERAFKCTVETVNHRLYKKWLRPRYLRSTYHSSQPQKIDGNATFARGSFARVHGVKITYTGQD